MAFRIILEPSVQRDVDRFADDTFRYWNISLAEIASNPFPRSAFYVEQQIPIRGFPARTWLYDITEETTISGERIFVYVVEFFPEHAVVYLVDEAAREVLVIYLRESPY